MHISFVTAELRDMCCRSGVAEVKIGGAVARTLRARLAEISAASTIDELPIRPTAGDGFSNMLFDLADGYVLRFEDGNPSKQTKNDATDWSKVVRVKIIGITKADV
jgi:hypothetical protein